MGPRAPRAGPLREARAHGASRRGSATCACAVASKTPGRQQLSLPLPPDLPRASWAPGAILEASRFRREVPQTAFAVRNGGVRAACRPRPAPAHRGSVSPHYTRRHEARAPHVDGGAAAIQRLGTQEPRRGGRRHPLEAGRPSVPARGAHPQ